MEENKQIIEVDYDKELVEEYKKNYIMEEDGIGDDGIVYSERDHRQMQYRDAAKGPSRDQHIGISAFAGGAMFCAREER